MKKLGLHDVLETERCILRIPQESEAEEVWNLVTPNIRKYLIRENVNTIRDSKNKAENGTIWDAVIYHKETDLAIGRISISYVCEETQSIELGYWLSEKYWGMGIVPECVNTIIRFSFIQADYQKIIATCDSDNSQSIQVLQKCSFVHEGTLRNHRKSKGILKNVSYYGILKKEYLSKN